MIVIPTSYFTSGPKAMMLLQTLETLDAIHQKGILHKDLKPGIL